MPVSSPASAGVAFPVAAGAGAGGGTVEVEVEVPVESSTTITIIAGNAVILTNAPAGATEISVARRIRADLTGRTEARVYNAGPAVGAAGATVEIRGSTNGGASFAALGVGGTGPTSLIDAHTTTAFGNWVDISGWGDTIISGFFIGGNGAADPSVSTLVLEVR